MYNFHPIDSISNFSKQNDEASEQTKSNSTEAVALAEVEDGCSSGLAAGATRAGAA